MKEFYQAKEFIEKSQNILIPFPQETNEDIFCGALALFYTLKELKKKVNLTLPRIPAKLNFLLDEEILENSNQHCIVISINTKGGKIDKILYEKDAQELKFYLNLRNGEVEIENISVKTEGEGPDLSIIINEGNLIFEPRGGFYGQKVVIQNSLESVSRTVKEFLQLFGENLINQDVATCLLAGLIISTQNFQNLNKNSEVLKEVSFLIKKGAHYQEIIKNLYKTCSIAEIKLFGQVLSKLNFDKERGIAWCSLTEEDFQNTNSSSSNLAFVLETLKLNFFLPPTLFLLWKGHCSQSLVKGVFYSIRSELIRKILENFDSVSKGRGVLFLIRNSNLKESEEKILNLIYGAVN
jgi:hypothetical protein